MDLAAAWAEAQPWLRQLEIWKGYEGDLETLLIYAIGIALYTALVFAFYQNISRVSAFLATPRSRALRAVQSALLFPLLSMCYFAVLAASLFLLAKSQTTYQILLLSMAVVLSVRVTSFLSENMSADLAKLLPLGLLGVLLVDPGALTLGAAWSRVEETPSLAPVLGRFVALFLVTEAFLRGVAWAVRRTRRAWKGRREPAQAPAPVAAEPAVAPEPTP